jgi:hypothetical protein
VLEHLRLVEPLLRHRSDRGDQRLKHFRHCDIGDGGRERGVRSANRRGDGGTGEADDE